MRYEPLSIIENTLKIINRFKPYEKTCDKLFAYFGTMIPLKNMGLGFYDRNHDRAFVLSRTGYDGTQSLFRYYEITDDIRHLYDETGFFSDPRDRLVTAPDDPLYALFNRPEVPIGLPFYSLRSIHSNLPLGAGTFELIPDALIPDDIHDIMRCIRLPLNLFISDAFHQWELRNANRELLEENNQLRQKSSSAKDIIIGADHGLRQLIEQIDRIADLDLNILLTGETGVGKDVIARHIHAGSNRAGKPFVAVNCGAVPESLIDNELFGHEKGAYTGAGETFRGRFEQSDGGTLFLDEIGELPLPAQTRLLRVLETRTVERLGGKRPIPVDFRLIAATNRDLARLKDEGAFRPDLYYRLAGVAFRIPPLRERRQDIPLLIRHFTKAAAKRFHMPIPTLPPGEFDKFMRFDWPGNVRQLQNAVFEAVAMSGEGVMRFPLGSNSEGGKFLPQEERARMIKPFDDMVRQYLEQALESAGGKIQGKGSAAEMLELNPNTLRTKLDKYGIPYGRKTK